MTKEEFLKRYNGIQNEQRVINVLHNFENIMQKLDETFEQRTSLNKETSDLPPIPNSPISGCLV